MENQGTASRKGHREQVEYEEHAICNGASEVIGAQEYFPTVTFRTAFVQPQAVALPFAEVIKLTREQLLAEVVRPLLAAQTRQELFQELGRRWSKYRSHSSVLDSLLQDVPALQSSIEDAVKIITERAGAIAGPSAFTEARFASDTYLSAIRMTARFRDLDAPANHEEDLKTWARFSMNAMLHNLGAWMICEACEDGVRATAIGLDAAFEFLRGGAVEAYVAARTAFSLREPKEDTAGWEPIPFDEEDDALASAV